MTLASRAAAVALSLGAWGCAEDLPGPEVLAQAYQLGAQHQWEAAMPLVREYLLAHPESIGGHFLFGQAHLHVQEPRFSIAIGELNTAEALYKRKGQLEDFAALGAPHGFYELYHQELAMAHLRLAYEAINLGYPERVIHGQLDLSLKQVELGLQANPDNAFLAELKDTLIREMATEHHPVVPERPKERAPREPAESLVTQR